MDKIVNFYNGSYIKKYALHLIPQKNLKSISLKKTAFKASHSWRSGDTYCRQINVKIESNKVLYKYERWEEGCDEDDWGSWVTDWEEITDLKRVVLCSRDIDLPDSIIIDYFNGNSKDLLIVEIQPYFLQICNNIVKYVKSEKTYDYIIDNPSKVKNGDYVDLPKGSVGVVTNANKQWLSAAVNDSNNYKYKYVTAHLLQGDNAIKCAQLIENSTHFEEINKYENLILDKCRAIEANYSYRNGDHDCVSSVDATYLNFNNKLYKFYTPYNNVDAVEIFKTLHQYYLDRADLYEAVVKFHNYTQYLPLDTKFTEFEFINYFGHLFASLRGIGNKLIYLVENPIDIYEI